MFHLGLCFQICRLVNVPQSCPGTSKCALIWNKVFAELISWNEANAGSWWTLNLMTGVFTREKSGQFRHRNTEETHKHHVKTEAETRGMQPQAKEHKGLPATMKSYGTDSPSEPPEGRNHPCQHPDFTTLASKKRERINLCCFKPPTS